MPIGLDIEETIGDPRFFTRTGPHSLAAIATAAGAEPAGDGARLFASVAPLETAAADTVSFLDNRRYAEKLALTAAGAVILHPSLQDKLPQGCIGLLTKEPYLAWARVCTLFFPPPPAHPSRHPSAAIDATASVDATAEIGALAVIGAGAVVGPGCRIEPHATIGAGVVMGAGCVIGANASVSHAVLGARVKLLPGARIGQEGFGFAPDGQGGFLTVPQLGRVVLHDDVEIGANTCIDRGSMHDTVLGPGTRLDNLVQIGHNVHSGRGCVIVSQAGISGSTILGDYVQVAGQAGLTGHLHIGSQARIGAQAGVMADVAAGASVLGAPCQPARDFFLEQTVLRKLARAEMDRARRGDRPPAKTADAERAE